MSLFFYVTYKLVLLKDKRLGVLYYVLVLLALIYTVVEIFIRKGYLDFDTNPHGTIKLILSDDFANGSLVAQDLPYCRRKAQCQYLDPWDLNWPSESRAVTITTYAKDRIQERLVSNDASGVEFNTTKENAYFTLGPEYVVIKLDHAVVASRFTDSQGKQALAASHRQLRGHLIGTSGDIIRTFAGDSPTTQGKADRITLQELLLAAGVQSLDDPSDILDARGRSFRQRGCILRVTVFYQNWMSTWIGTSAMDYRYYVERMPYVDFTSKQVDPLLSKEEVLEVGGVHKARWRLQRKRYSVRVEFSLAGTLAMFSFSTLLMKLVSGAALLTLVATIVDTLALYLLPNKGTYRKIVYEESQDFKRKRKQDDRKQQNANRGSNGGVEKEFLDLQQQSPGSSPNPKHETSDLGQKSCDLKQESQDGRQLHKHKTE